MSERRIVLRPAEGELEHVLDHAIVVLPAGVRVDAENNELVAVGEPHELAPVEQLEKMLGKLLREPPRDEPA